MAVKKIEQMLDEQGTLGNLPRWGKLRKGALKPEGKIGPDLDHFRLTLEPPYAHLMPAFIAKYTDKPREFHNVYLVGDSADNAFQYWYEQRAHARIEKRCDGEEIVMSWSGSNSRYDFTHQDCTCDPNNPTCKLRGKMDIVLPEFCTEMGEWGKLTIETGSWYDIIALRKSMRLAAVFAANLPDIAFWSIPFRVGRAIRPVQVTINGQRSNKPMSLLYADPEKEFNHKVFSPILNAPTQVLLATANPEVAVMPEIIREQKRYWDYDWVIENTAEMFDNENHQQNTIDKMIADGELTDDMNDADAHKAIHLNRARRQAEKQQETRSKKPRKNAAKSNVEGSNSSESSAQDNNPYEWVNDPQKVAKLISASKLNMGQVIRALQWATGNYKSEAITDFHITDTDAWAACICQAFNFDSRKILASVQGNQDNEVYQTCMRLMQAKDIPF